MAIIIERTVNLAALGMPEQAQGTLYQHESLAHRFVIHGRRGGADVNFTGNVSAYFIKPDGETVDITNGTLDGGAAVVELPQICYAVSGRFMLTIFVTSGSTKTAVYSMTGNVRATKTDGEVVPPGTPVPEYSEIIGQYRDMVQATDAARAADAKIERIANATTVVNGTVAVDSETVWNAGYYYANGTVTSSSAYNYSQKVAVYKGDEVCVINPASGNKVTLRTVTAYNGDAAITESGSDEAITGSYTVPAGINYVRFTVSNASALSSFFVRVESPALVQKTDNELTQENVAADSKAVGKEIKRVMKSLGDVSEGLIDIDGDPEWNNGYVYADGTVTASGSYSYSPMVEVEPGYIINVINPATTNKVRMRTVTAYAGETAIAASGSDEWVDNNYIVPQGIDHVRVTVARTSTYFVRITKPGDVVTPKGIVNAAIGANPFRHKPFMSHIYVGVANPPIPNQSVYDIWNSKKLGFSVIEGNVHKTSDNKYICMHGSNGKFGNAVHHVDGETDISTVSISSVTLTWIQENVRYNSIYAKYQTQPTTLEEFLYECRINQMIPMITGTDKTVIEIANGIMGKDNYISYGGRREYTNAPILVFESLTSKDDILAMCDTYGVPFIYSMDNPTAFTDVELAEIIDAVHQKGCLLGMASTYISYEETLRLLSLGFDMAASTFQVNDFDNGNIANLYGDTDFDQFDTNGSAADGDIVLAANQYVRTKEALWENVITPFIGKASLRVRLNGQATITLAGKNISVTTDGLKDVWVSGMCHSALPDFMISAVSSTTIYSIEFHAGAN